MGEIPLPFSSMADVNPHLLKEVLMDRQKWNSIAAKAILTTINKFRENPQTFFNEHDMHGFLFKEMYGKGLISETSTNNNINISRLHLEYPTNFSYSTKFIEENKLKPSQWQLLLNRYEHTKANQSKRGNFDMVILNDNIIKNQIKLYIRGTNKGYDVSKYQEIVNRIINITQKENGNSKLIDLVVEMKFINAYRSSFIKEIAKDNIKLACAQRNLPKTLRPKCINLVFCALPDTTSNKKRGEKQRNIVQKLLRHVVSPEFDKKHNILCIFVQAWMGLKGKENKKPETNKRMDWKRAIEYYLKDG